MTTFAKHVGKDVSTSLVLNKDLYTITSDFKETQIMVSLPGYVIKTIINLYFKLNPGEVNKFLNQIKREYQFNSKLSENELNVFKYLQGKTEFVSPKKIGMVIGGKLPDKGASKWGSVICRKLLSKGYLERNNRGHYLIKDIS